MEKSSHPTAMMLTSTVNLLKTLSLSAGIYAEVLQTDATRTLCGLLRMLVESGANDKSGSRTEPLFLKKKKKRAKFWVLSDSKWSHFCRQAVTPTDWSLGSSTETGARWDSYAASLSCPRCAACSAPLRGSACSSELWKDTSHSTPLLCRDRWIFHYSCDAFKIISKLHSFHSFTSFQN